MDTGRLLAAATLLEGLDTGEWLTGRLKELGPSSETPRVLVLVSARRGGRAAFGDGLKLCPHWVVLGAEAESGAAVEGYDLVVWGMSALKLFPAEYAPALETACREGIPIWAVVVGLELLTDRQEFIDRIVPQNKARLPAFSEIILCQGEEVAGALRQLLAENGEQIARAGRLRWKTSLGGDLWSRLSQERRALSGEAGKTLDLTGTAKLGGESVKVMSRTTARAIFADFRNLPALIDALRLEIEGAAASLPKTFDARDAQSELWRRLSEMRAERVETELARLENESAAKLRLWCAEASAEMKKFFTPLRDAAWPDGAFERATEITLEEAALKLRPVFDDLSRNVLGQFDDFVVKTDFLTSARRDHEPQSPTRVEPLYRWQEPDDEFTAARASQPAHRRRQDNAPGFGGRLKRGLLRKMNQILRSVGINELGEARSKEERAVTNLTRELQVLNFAVVEVFDSTREKCKVVLSQLVDKHTDALLDLTGQMTRRLHTKLQKLDEAEQLLSGDG